MHCTFNNRSGLYIFRFTFIFKNLIELNLLNTLTWEQKVILRNEIFRNFVNNEKYNFILKIQTGVPHPIKSEDFLQPSQTSKMELFTQLVNGSILYVWCVVNALSRKCQVLKEWKTERDVIHSKAISLIIALIFIFLADANIDNNNLWW